MMAQAQRHTRIADVIRGFRRHEIACFEDEKSPKIEAFGTAQIGLNGPNAAQPASGGTNPVWSRETGAPQNLSAAAKSP
jgi:hypothetical protein